jgi:NAD(P)-dependent dehydrogenase (short-subunit alcohol dehydrogenase family)
MHKSGLDEATVDSINKQLTNAIPLKKMGDAADVAKLVVYCCEAQANFITGAEIIVDGGMTL